MARVLTLACALLWPAAALAQTGGRVVVDGERFRAAPDGAILATLEKGTPLGLGRRQGAWQEATLEAWIWRQSARAEQNGPHQLVISARGGENLRAAPNGALLAYGRTGMRLEEVERAGEWIRVRRTGWVQAAAVRPDPPAPQPAPGGERPLAGPPPEPAVRASGPAGAANTGPGGAVLLARPGGDTLARLRPGIHLPAATRQGDWVRVRLEGWIPASALAGDSVSAILTDVPASALAEDPGAFNGRVLEWSVEFIALERAEPIRTDFRTGEHFILARGPAGEEGFVYVGVPAQLLPEVERIAPLSRMRIRARIRNARSPLTDAPILDLLQIVSVSRPDR